MGHDEQLDELLDGLERLGFDSLWVSERIVSPIYDPLVALAYAAGRTRRLKLGTSVLVLPGRNPALLAKELAGLDRISDGRLLLAFGLGLADPLEQQAFGVDRRSRGALLDEIMPLLRRFWSEPKVDHEGPRFRYEGLSVLPKPSQQPLDLWLGGFGPAALRRVGRQADGWLPSQITPPEAAAGRVAIEQAAAEAGRAIDPEHFGALVVYAHDRIPPALVASIATRRPDLDPAALVPVGFKALRARLEEFVAVGVSKLVVRPAEGPRSWTAELENLAEAVLGMQR
jgi:probable F420-dependent oxidoreductase